MTEFYRRVMAEHMDEQRSLQTRALLPLDALAMLEQREKAVAIIGLMHFGAPPVPQKVGGW